MRQIYELFPFLENMQQAVAQIGQKVPMDDAYSIGHKIHNLYKTSKNVN